MNSGIEDRAEAGGEVFFNAICAAFAAEYLSKKKNPNTLVGDVVDELDDEITSFADLMTPQEAARYELYNEKVFFNEFSTRASAAGLNNTQISEAFEAMRRGDYVKMASYFDTSSPVNGAVFWSGNKKGAAAYANSIGGTILEQTPGGKVFDNWRGLQGMYPKWNDQKPIWDALSSQYANATEGIAIYVHTDGYLGKTWLSVENPILRENDIIISEVIIDAE